MSKNAFEKLCTYTKYLYKLNSCHIAHEFQTSLFSPLHARVKGSFVRSGQSTISISTVLKLENKPLLNTVIKKNYM
jgi:hypothetical protein